MEKQASKTEILENFRARLKSAMARHDTTLQEVADHLKISVSTVGAWTQGKNFPQTELQPALAAFLGESVQFLIHGISVIPGVYPESVSQPKLVKEPKKDDRKRRHQPFQRGDPMRIAPGFEPPAQEPTREQLERYVKTFLDLADRTPGGRWFAWHQIRTHLDPSSLEKLHDLLP